MRMSDERSTILKKIRGSQNSLGFWTPCCEFQIPGTQISDCLSVELGFKIEKRWWVVGFQIT